MSAEEALFQRYGQEYPKGTVVFSDGEPGKQVFVLQSGRVEIIKKVGELETRLAVLGPGEFFGEMAIISNKPRSATAVVTEDAKLLVIDPKTFEGMIRGNSEIALRMIKRLAERLSDASEQIENLLLMDPHRRVVHRLLQVCQSHGRPTEEGVEIPFSAREQPTHIGVGEAGIRWILSRLERAGLVERRADRVTVRDTARLQDYLKYLEMKWKFGDL
jgi:CRP/FNR family transcriptional regulator, cyclic AMP receptor protein